MASAFIASTNAANKVVVWSKSYCPFCTKAKKALERFLTKAQYTVIELDERSDGDAIQDALLALTGGRSVPRVFVGGKFIGGGDDTDAASRNGKLEVMLREAGAL